MAQEKQSLASFAQTYLQRPLYPYQKIIAEAILDSVLHNKGLTFTVMLSRQMGKNQLSAIIEAYLLYCKSEGTIVKAAPTFKPQIVTSRTRLLDMLKGSFLAPQVWTSYGYMVGVAPSAQQSEAQIGPRTIFFSADPDSSIMGATASLLLEIDEAQDVSVDKFNRDLKPMASSTNATTVLYGTPWGDDSLLARVVAMNQELEQQDGIRRHFQYDWHALAEINPEYQAFVQGEIQRLGEDDTMIRTQYRLLTISGAGYLLAPDQHHFLVGRHTWEDEPDEDADGYYIAGMDVGGEERASGNGSTGSTQGKRDSTVVSIARVTHDELDLPTIEIVHQYCFTGMLYAHQVAVTSEIIRRWELKKIVIDATGLGEGLASLLTDRFTTDTVTPFRFSRESKSRLTYQFLSTITGGRFRLYARDGAPTKIYAECWKQMRLARCRVPSTNKLDMCVPSEDGHDDFLISLALCCEGAKDAPPLCFYSRMILPPPIY